MTYFLGLLFLVVMISAPIVVAGWLFSVTLGRWLTVKPPRGRSRSVQDEVLEAQWRYDNLWRRRD